MPAASAVPLEIEQLAASDLSRGLKPLHGYRFYTFVIVSTERMITSLRGINVNYAIWTRLGLSITRKRATFRCKPAFR